jgi:hypothetical protein
MGLRVGKILILPKVDKIKDPEAKRVIQQLFRVLQEINANNYSDLAGLDGRVTELEP